MNKKDAQKMVQKHFMTSITDATSAMCVATICLTSGEETEDLLRRQAAILAQLMSAMRTPHAGTFDELVEGLHEIGQGIRNSMPKELEEIVTSL